MANREFDELIQPESLSAESLGIQRVGRGSRFSVTPSNHGEKGQWSRHLRNAVASNYYNTYVNAPSHLRNMGEQFFPNWNEDAHHIAGMLGEGHTVEHGAALMAHLSPSNEAELNRIQAIQLAHHIRDDHFTPSRMDAMEEASQMASLAKGLGTRARNAEGSERGRLLDQKAHAEMVKDAARRHVGLEGTPLGGIDSSVLFNAVRSTTSSEPLQTLRNSKGHPMKIFHFGHNIAHWEDYDQPTIDTHAHDAGLGRIDIPYAVNRGLESVARVGAFQDQMARAHRRYTNETGSDVPLSGFMGGLWFPHLQRKVFESDDANAARKASETRLTSIQNDPANQMWIPGRGEHASIRPSFGKIQTR